MGGSNGHSKIAGMSLMGKRDPPSFAVTSSFTIWPKDVKAYIAGIAPDIVGLMEKHSKQKCKYSRFSSTFRCIQIRRLLIRMTRSFRIVGTLPRKRTEWFKIVMSPVWWLGIL